MVNAVVHTPERALVTGGAGFIGASLVRLLLERGVSVRVMKVPGDPATNLRDVMDQIDLVDGDLLDPASLRRALEGCDTLFHLAAIYAIWLPVPRRMFDVNVQGTRNILSVARELGVSRVVHTSSIAAVGSRGDKRPADETCGFNAWDIASDYVLSKYISELEAQRFAQEGLNVTIVNPAFPFGWGDIGPTPTGAMIQLLLKGMPVIMGGGLNAVGVTDVAMGHILAAERGRVGARYILGGENDTYAGFAKRVAQVAGIRGPRMTLPGKLFLAGGRIGDLLADHVTHSKPLVAHKTVAYTVDRNLWFDISRAKAELGYDPAPLDQHIEQAVRWFREGIGG